MCVIIFLFFFLFLFLSRPSISTVCAATDSLSSHFSSNIDLCADRYFLEKLFY